VQLLIRARNIFGRTVRSLMSQLLGRVVLNGELVMVGVDDNSLQTDSQLKLFDLV